MKSIYRQFDSQHKTALVLASIKAITSILFISYILYAQAAYAIVMPESLQSNPQLHMGIKSVAGDGETANTRENIQYSGINYRRYINNSVYSLKSSYEFILFYRSTCPHCQRFDPILKQFSDITGIRVVAFTTDGVALPAFPNSVPVSRQVIAQYFGQGAQIFVPTLFLLNTDSHKL